jgi:polysaccharide biosynthesis transport protein
MNMNLQQMLLILRAHYKLALAVWAFVVVATVIFCLVFPARYAATTTVVVDSKSPDPVASLMIASGVLPNVNLNMGTEIEVVTSERVARRVVKLLKLDEDEEIKALWRDDTDGKGTVDSWLAGLLLKKLSVKPASLNTNVLPIKFTGSDPYFAAAVANAFAQAYIDVNIELKVEPAKQYVQWFAQQDKSLRESLEKAQTALSRFQQEKGLVAKEEQYDTENTKLAELTKQLSTVQSQVTDVASKERFGDAAEALPEVTQNQLITSLKSDISRQEAKLREVAGNLGKNHPQYQRMENELAALREKLQAELRRITGSFATTLAVAKNTEASVKAAIEAQKMKLLQMKSDRDRLAMLQQEVDAAKKALDAVSSRAQQSRFDSEVTRTNVSVLTPAVPPLEPSFPKFVLYTLLSIPAGAVLGLAAAFGIEMVDRRIRCAADLVEFESPVLAVLEAPRVPTRWSLTQWQRLRRVPRLILKS